MTGLENIVTILHFLHIIGVLQCRLRHFKYLSIDWAMIRETVKQLYVTPCIPLKVDRSF
jgi:hypothetical protein